MAKKKKNPSSCGRIIEGGIDKYIMDCAHNTITNNAYADEKSLGWARFPGPEACEFCITLGSRDTLYKTKETAGGDLFHGTENDRYHAYCRCGVLPVFGYGNKYFGINTETGLPVEWNHEEQFKHYQKIIAKSDTPHYGKSKKATTMAIDWRTQHEYARKLYDAATLEELYAVGGEIDALVPVNLRKTKVYKELQRIARMRETVFKHQEWLLQREQKAAQYALRSKADPAFEYFGRAEDSHPELLAAIKEDLEASDVKITCHDKLHEKMAYGPSAIPGEPGNMVVTEDMSICAWLHEYTHFSDDRNNGYPGLGWYFEKNLFEAMERAGYGAEIEFAKSSGYNELADKLDILLNDEVKRIRDRSINHVTNGVRHKHVADS